MMTANTDKLLTAKDAATLYSIHEKTFREWSKSKPGWPKAVLIGTAQRWRFSEIQKHIAEMDNIAA